ncbi:hypothetical protein B484DRAFT_304802, partial [Ochromonadaceae sp. CCMP2298]
DDTVATAVQVMNAMSRGSVLVLDREGRLAGIFTERDFVTKILESDKVSADTQMGSVMTPQDRLVTASVTAALDECRQKMLANNIRHLPLVDGSGLPVGVISIRDIIVSLQQE